jgi:hypothetical protein
VLGVVFSRIEDELFPSKLLYSDLALLPLTEFSPFCLQLGFSVVVLVVMVIGVVVHAVLGDAFYISNMTGRSHT